MLEKLFIEAIKQIPAMCVLVFITIKYLQHLEKVMQPMTAVIERLTGEVHEMKGIVSTKCKGDRHAEER